MELAASEKLRRVARGRVADFLQALVAGMVVSGSGFIPEHLSEAESHGGREVRHCDAMSSVPSMSVVTRCKTGPCSQPRLRFLRKHRLEHF